LILKFKKESSGTIKDIQLEAINRELLKTARELENSDRIIFRREDELR